MYTLKVHSGGCLNIDFTFSIVKCDLLCDTETWHKEQIVRATPLVRQRIFSSSFCSIWFSSSIALLRSFRISQSTSFSLSLVLKEIQIQDR